eukprot:CAMPEP_0197842738 /NCGR_PEP_ID=MMETSP1437-20131217/46914_1 /TAXON_ID=49252 ORGANISM="Eucampia antarctica, Strain CCMP1452" /NCGR_SAMPLE_ID=MMETSP1437 /ASSEMBLY_ACC=CAM_ASM_001096 /LENGTH=61 /DNA_ID=CAMNT_0043452663 /DNA_START=634 /DNA_END=816 /DNA_ORIENTATION=+
MGRVDPIHALNQEVNINPAGSLIGKDDNIKQVLVGSIMENVKKLAHTRKDKEKSYKLANEF